MTERDHEQRNTEAKEELKLEVEEIADLEVPEGAADGVQGGGSKPGVARGPGEVGPQIC